MHAVAARGYAPAMTDPLPDPIPDPDDLPEKDPAFGAPLEPDLVPPTPFEPGVTNPDADGTDDSVVS